MEEDEGGGKMEADEGGSRNMKVIVVIIFQQYSKVTYIALQGIIGNGLHDEEDAL